MQAVRVEQVRLTRLQARLHHLNDFKRRRKMPPGAVAAVPNISSHPPPGKYFCFMHFCFSVMRGVSVLSAATVEAATCFPHLPQHFFSKSCYLSTMLSVCSVHFPFLHIVYNEVLALVHKYCTTFTLYVVGIVILVTAVSLAM